MKKFILTLCLLSIFVLKIGKSVIIQEQGWTTPRLAIVYCGMPTDKTFSISSGYYRDSTNLYYPVNTEKFEYHEKIIDIIEVKPTHMKIEIKE